MKQQSEKRKNIATSFKHLLHICWFQKEPFFLFFIKIAQRKRILLAMRVTDKSPL